MARYNSSSLTTSINGTATVTSPYSGAFTNLTGTAPYTVTLPAPGLFPGTSQTFYNSTAGTVTLSTPSGIFGGLGASGSGTLAMPTNTVTTVTSDGTNYIVLSEDGSALVATSGSFTGNVYMGGGTATVNINASTVNINPSSSGTLNNMSIGGTTRAAGSFVALNANGQVNFTSNTASSSTTTGSLVVTGGIGATGTVYAGGFNGNLTGTIQTASQTNITSLGTLSGLSVTGTTTLTGTLGITGNITSTSNAPFSLQSNGNTGTYTQTVIYNNQNNTSGNVSNGMFIERGRLTDSAVGEIRSFVIGDRGGAVQLILNKDGNLGIGTGTSTPVARLDVRGTVSTGGPIWLGSVGDNSAYDNVAISYTGYNSGNPQIIFQPRTTPGSGTVNSTFYFKNSNGASTTNNTANVQVDGYISQNGTLYAEKTFDLGYFPHLSANQVVYLNFGNGYLNGSMEVTITSTYSYQNATGLIRKVFSFGFDPGNSQWYPATSRISEADGPIRDNIVIGEMEWDSSGSQYRLPIYHVVSSGNSFYAHVRSLGSANIVPTITVSGFSTRSSPITAANSNFINIAGKRLFRDGDIAMWNGAGTGATLSTIVSNNDGWVGFSDRYNGDSSVFETVGSTPFGIRIKKAGWVHYYYDQDIITSGASGYVSIQSAKNGSVLQYQLITHTNSQWDAIIIGGAVNVAANDVINFRISGGDILALDGGTWSNVSLIWYGIGG